MFRAIIALTVATIFFISGCSSNLTKQRKRSSQYSQKDKGKVDLYESELEDWSKQVQVQRGLVLSLWDVTLEGMFSKGYDTKMVCDN